MNKLLAALFAMTFAAGVFAADAPAADAKPAAEASKPAPKKAKKQHSHKMDKAAPAAAASPAK